MLAKSLSMSKVIVVVNKMDDRSVNYSQTRFNEIKDDVLRIAGGVGYKPEDLEVVPISAWTGENVVTAPSSMPWYNGPMLFEVMEQVARAVTTSAPGEVVAKRPVFGPTRVSILQRVNKRCTTTGTDIAQKQEEVVKALVQWGTVREGQVLEGCCRRPSSHRPLDVVRVSCHSRPPPSPPSPCAAFSASKRPDPGPRRASTSGCD